MKFSSKLSLPIIAIGIIALLSLALTVFYSARETLQESIVKSQLQSARQIMSTIDRILFQAYEDINIIAEDEIVEGWLEKFGTENEEKANIEKIARKTLQEKALLTGPWDSLFVVDTAGIIIEASDPTELGKNIETEPYGLRAFESGLQGNRYYSDLVISEDTRRATVIFAAPVKSGRKIGHKVNGVVIGHFVWHVVLELLDEIDPKLHVHLLNKRGLVIAGRPHDKEHILKANYAQLDLVRRALRRETGKSDIFKDPDEDRVVVLGSYALQKGYLGYRGKGWSFFLETPVQEVFAPISHLTRKVVVMTITFLLIISVFVYFISKRLTDPIVALTEKVKIFSFGNLSTRILVTTKDEVGYLGTSFNEMAANIEKSVKEREQVQKTLQRAKVSAEAATRAKSEFLANVSHELRTPMNSIVGMNYLLKETELTSQQKEYLDETDQASRKLQEILNNILDFTKIDQDETIMGATRFDLNDVLTKIVDQADTKARKKGLTLKFCTNPEIPTILEGDPERLGQVLHHLLDNAIKFTEQGGVALGVSRPQLAVSDHPYSIQHPESIIRLRFEVVDTGIGIPREQVEDLFQPFVQLDGSSTRKYGGIGLGLSTCKRLAELMEGEISVNSEVGKGSIFSFTAKFGCITDDSLQAVEKSAGERADIEGTEVLSNASRRKDIENLAPRLQELAGLLKINDMRAETVFAEVKEELHAVIPAETNELKQKLDNLDFKGALNSLVAIAEFFNILLEKGTDT